MEFVNNIFSYKNLKLNQDSEMFTISIESILLPHFATINSRVDKILDIGTNNAIIPLILSTRTKKPIVGVEIQAKACKIAHRNVIENNLIEQITVIHQDIKEYNKSQAKYNLIICNPPFFANNKKYSALKKEVSKKLARHEDLLTLSELIISAKKLINNKGYFVTCHRIERLTEVLAKCVEAKLTPKRLQFIHPYANKKAISFMLETRFQSASGMIVLPPIVLHNPDGSFREEIKKLY